MPKAKRSCFESDPDRNLLRDAICDDQIESARNVVLKDGKEELRAWLRNTDVRKAGNEVKEILE